MNKLFGGAAGGLVGGAAWSAILTGVGLVTLGPVGAAIGFGIGTIGGTASGAMLGQSIAKKVEGVKIYE